MVRNKTKITSKLNSHTTRVFLASEGGNPNLTANFLHGGLFVCIDDWVKNPRKSPGAKPPKNGFFKMAA